MFTNLSEDGVVERPNVTVDPLRLSQLLGTAILSALLRTGGRP